MLNGIKEKKGLTEWLNKDVAPLLDALLIDDDKREVILTSKLRNEYRIKSSSTDGGTTNSGRIIQSSEVNGDGVGLFG